MRIITRFAGIFIFFVLLFVFQTPALAEGEFAIDYDVLYKATNDLKLNVTQEITLTNKTTQFFATESSLTLGKIKAENITASDNLGPLVVESNFDGDTTIKVKFNQKIVGSGKNFTFKVSYDASELLSRNGQVTEISIPKLAPSADLSSYDLTLEVPAGFGPLAYVSPQPVSSSVAKSVFSGGVSRFIFNKDQLEKNGISASFGQSQVFEFELNYHLQNPNLVTIVTEIAIPSDTPYQKLVYSEISPRPLDVYQDQDGNWLAKYKLSSKDNIDVVATGFAELFPQSQFKEELDANRRSNYLKSQKYWETDNNSIYNKAKELKVDNDSKRTAGNIYDFVVGYLTYNQERLNSNQLDRLGAAYAYNNPESAVCMEFTDLFIALSRVAGVPAREINGFAYTQNERLRPLSLRSQEQDVLHAWPEYYDDTLGWIAVDPTWASTTGGIDYFSKLDFNHFSFVRKGISSENPLPAGAYKYDENQGPDVIVKVSEKRLEEVKSKIEMDLDIPGNIIAGFPTIGVVTLKNLTGTATAAANLTFEITGASLESPTEQLIILPPFANKEIKFVVTQSNLFYTQKGNIKVVFDKLTREKSFNVRPAILFIIAGLVIIIIFASSVVFLIFFVVKKFKKTSNNPPI